MACAISKVPDIPAAIKEMSRVFFHLCRRFSYSRLINEFLKMNIQLLRFHRYKCQRSTKPISIGLNDKSSRNRHALDVVEVQFKPMLITSDHILGHNLVTTWPHAHVKRVQSRAVAWHAT